MMSRFFHSSAKALLKWLGFDRKKLSPSWNKAIDTFTAPGGSAEGKLGPLEEVYIKSRDGNPVHHSLCSPGDKQLVISARIKGQNGTKVCHIYEDGTGTTKKGDERC